MNIELFGCSGGMAEGFRRAGIAFDLVVERDADACASYEANLGRRPAQMDVHDLARLLGPAACGRQLSCQHCNAPSGWFYRASDGEWIPACAFDAPTSTRWPLPRRGEVDLIVADPPCTPWSHAGKRQGIADERDCLLVTVEIIQLLRPRCYVIGNVPGLNDSNQWPHLQRALAPLREVAIASAILPPSTPQTSGFLSAADDPSGLVTSTGYAFSGRRQRTATQHVLLTHSQVSLTCFRGRPCARRSRTYPSRRWGGRCDHRATAPSSSTSATPASACPMRQRRC